MKQARPEPTFSFWDLFTGQETKCVNLSRHYSPGSLELWALRRAGSFSKHGLLDLLLLTTNSSFSSLGTVTWLLPTWNQGCWYGCSSLCAQKSATLLPRPNPKFLASYRGSGPTTKPSRTLLTLPSSVHRQLHISILFSGTIC